MAKATTDKTPWFDDAKDSALLAEYARKLDSFLDVVADGRVDAKELEAQEKVTHLLCEVTAYDLMHAMYLAGTSRPHTRFRG
jgi:hypothetical protein